MLLLGGFLLVSLTRVTVKRSTSSASPARGESERRVTAQGQSYIYWDFAKNWHTHGETYVIKRIIKQDS